MAVAAACAAVAVGAAGCGGDDDSTSGDDTTAAETTAVDTTDVDTTSADITKEEWIEQADAICSAGDQAVAEAGESSGLNEDSSEEDVQAFIADTVIPNIADQAEQIEALPVPAGEEEAIGSLTDALNQAVSDAEADPAAILTGTEAFDDVNAQAQDYGLTSCGNG